MSCGQRSPQIMHNQLKAGVSAFLSKEMFSLAFIGELRRVYGQLLELANQQEDKCEPLFGHPEPK